MKWNTSTMRTGRQKDDPLQVSRPYVVSQHDEGPEKEGEREEDYRRERDQQFSYKSLGAISQILIEAGVIISSSSDEKETFDEVPTTAITITEDNAEPTSSKAKN